MNQSPTTVLDVLLWPIVFLWQCLTFIVKAVGRLLCAVIGLAFLVCGVAISMSIVGLPLGVPISILGVLLMVRAVF